MKVIIIMGTSTVRTKQGLLRVTLRQKLLLCALLCALLCVSCGREAVRDQIVSLHPSDITEIYYIESGNSGETYATWMPDDINYIYSLMVELPNLPRPRSSNYGVFVIHIGVPINKRQHRNIEIPFDLTEGVSRRNNPLVNILDRLKKPRYKLPWSENEILREGGALTCDRSDKKFSRCGGFNPPAPAANLDALFKQLVSDVG
jgi:hypothetical protein